MATLGTYSYSLVRRILNGMIHNRADNLNSGSDTNVERDLINRGVRDALSEIEFRGNIRETILTPSLSDCQWEYSLPTDFKADNLIDLRPQSDTRGEWDEFHLVSPREFDRRKRVERNIATILNDDLTRTLRVSSNIDNTSTQVSSMEDTNWRTFDTDGVNDSDVKVDNDDFLEGVGSIRFQTDTTDTTDSTVGVQNTVITTFDISSYLARGQAFVDAKLTTADTGIHQITLRLGSDSSNYYQISDSNQNDCTAFVAGWNRIRWDLNNKTTVGTPADTAIDYAAIFWSRDTTTTALLHLNDTDWGFDNLRLVRGKYYSLSYYTRLVWQDTTLALFENSTHDSHALMLQNDELKPVMLKIAEYASHNLRDKEDELKYANDFKEAKQEYQLKNPSQSDVLTSDYYNFGFEGEDINTDNDT